jgi:S-adenosylmethionine decarboxylase
MLKLDIRKLVDGAITMEYLGIHIVAELYGCNAQKLADVEYVTESMLEAARRAKCTIVTQSFHHFSPHGVSGAIIISESHLAIHTWPEYQYAALDVFTCGDTIQPDIALLYLKDAFEAESLSATELRRGQAAIINAENPLKVKQG